MKFWKNGKGKQSYDVQNPLDEKANLFIADIKRTCGKTQLLLSEN